MVGQTIAHYTILEKLGEGGMGVVYKALDTRLERHVALKFLPPHSIRDGDREARFLQEARAASNLNHPNVCTIYDLIEEDNHLCIVMEYVDGTTLRMVIRHGSPDLQTSLDYAIAIGDALAEAHRKGIVHRDIKSENIMVNSKNQIKVTDFGLAKLKGSVQLTRSSGTVGTLAYMAPEQIQGMGSDPRSDLFSFGIVVFEMLTGRLPFRGDHEAAMMYAILHEEPESLQAVRPDLPSAIDQIVRRALEKDPAQRYQTVREMVNDLQKARSHEPSAAHPIFKASRHNLPIQLTSFVGRAREREHVKHLLRNHQLTTLIGSGGAGKTRLALQVASEVVLEYPDGAWLVDLAPITDPTLIPRAVASVVRVAEQPDKHVLDTLSTQLLDKNLLLVLDNCEHLVEACAMLAEHLLRAVPGLRVLATSREALNIGGEVAWRVPSLSLPDPGDLPPVEEVKHFEAVQLFLDRAAVHRPGFRMTDQHVMSVARICHRLDGVPLAIELAAARVKFLALDDILNRLEDRFKLLGGGSRTALPRQQTLRAAVDWSHDLLTESERVLFRRVSAFASGFTMEAAEETCPDDILARENVIDLLSQLVAKSLVNVDTDEDGTVRYHLLETLRQYGREKLTAAGEETALADSHLRYFVEFAERAYIKRFDESAVWLRRLERDFDNFRAALDWCHMRHPHQELQLAGALGWFLYHHTEHLAEGGEWLSIALKERGGVSPMIARALWGATMVALWRGNVHTALPYAQESLRMWREIGNQQEIGLSLEALGWTYFFSGNDHAALPSMEESLRIALGVDNPRLINRAKVGLCQVLVSMGNVGAVEPMATEILRIGTALGELRDIHYSLHFLGDCALYRGNGGEAEEWYSRSLQAALDYGNVAEAAVEMQGLAMSLAAQAKTAKAFRLNGAAEAKMKAVGIDASAFGFWTGFKNRYLGAARTSCGEATAAAFEGQGCTMGFKGAVAYALNRSQD